MASKTASQSLAVRCRKCGTMRFYTDICGCQFGFGTEVFIRKGKKKGEIVANRMYTFKNAGESLMHQPYKDQPLKWA